MTLPMMPRPTSSEKRTLKLPKEDMPGGRIFVLKRPKWNEKFDVRLPRLLILPPARSPCVRTHRYAGFGHTLFYSRSRSIYTVRRLSTGSMPVVYPQQSTRCSRCMANSPPQGQSVVRRTIRKEHILGKRRCGDHDSAWFLDNKAGSPSSSNMASILLALSSKECSSTKCEILRYSNLPS